MKTKLQRYRFMMKITLIPDHCAKVRCDADVAALEAELLKFQQAFGEALLDIDKLKARELRLVEILKTSDCPNCPNQGWYMKQGANEEVYEEQCQWCAERDAILNREQEKQP